MTDTGGDRASERSPDEGPTGRSGLREGPDRVPHHSLVTGASAGLGRAIALALLERGHLVIGLDRDPPTIPDPFAAATSAAATSAAEAIPASATDARGPSAYTHHRCDLGDPDAIDALLDDLAGGPPLRAAVMAAGISATGRFEALPASAHSRVMRVNAEAPIVMIDALLSRGVLAGSARVVLVASLSVDTAYPGAAGYAASKDALAAYGRSMNLARRAARRGTAPIERPRVLTVLPGPLRTEHAARHAPPGASEEARMTPEDCAARIVRAMETRRTVLRPGASAWGAGLLARLAPGLAARGMRRWLFERLDREVF